MNKLQTTFKRRVAVMCVPLLAFSGGFLAIHSAQNAAAVGVASSDFGGALGTIGQGVSSNGVTGVFDGYGCMGVVPTTDGNQVLSLKPQTVTNPGMTSAALVTTDYSMNDFDATVNVLNVAQLRQGYANPWEVGWFGWHYVSENDFMYFILKPNGWELGRVYDPNNTEAQSFLATGSNHTATIGRSYQLRVKQVGQEITVWVDGMHVVTHTGTHTDPNVPVSSSGKFAFYTEDAHVLFDNLKVVDDPMAGVIPDPPMPISPLAAACGSTPGVTTTVPVGTNGDYYLNFLYNDGTHDHYSVSDAQGGMVNGDVTHLWIVQNYVTYPGTGYVIPLAGPPAVPASTTIPPVTAAPPTVPQTLPGSGPTTTLPVSGGATTTLPGSGGGTPPTTITPGWGTPPVTTPAGYTPTVNWGVPSVSAGDLGLMFAYSSGGVDYYNIISPSGALLHAGVTHSQISGLYPSYPGTGYVIPNSGTNYVAPAGTTYGSQAPMSGYTPAPSVSLGTSTVIAWDGTMTISYPDGRVVNMFPNGTTQTVSPGSAPQPNGVTLGPASVWTAPSPSPVVLGPSQTITQSWSSSSGTQVSGGTTTVDDPDGSITITYPDGRTVRMDKDGTVTTISAGSSGPDANGVTIGPAQTITNNGVRLADAQTITAPQIGTALTLERDENGNIITTEGGAVTTNGSASASAQTLERSKVKVRARTSRGD